MNNLTTVGPSLGYIHTDESKEKMSVHKLGDRNSMFNKGFHYLPEGFNLIQEIISQMNNYRLSVTDEQEALYTRDMLHKSVTKFLERPSNFSGEAPLRG